MHRERHVVVVGAAVRRELRHADQIWARHIAGGVAAKLDRSAGRCEEGLGLGDAGVGVFLGRGLRMVMVGQAADLVDIEDDIALQERDRPLNPA